MRIPCAKCGHPHDSTVTPFMHDIVTPEQPESGALANVMNSSFKCEGCGNINEVMLIWSVLEEEDAPEDTNQIS